MDDLPPEVLLEVFSYLDFGEILRLKRTCRFWRDLIALVWIDVHVELFLDSGTGGEQGLRPESAVEYIDFEYDSATLSGASDTSETLPERGLHIAMALVEVGDLAFRWRPLSSWNTHFEDLLGNMDHPKYMGVESLADIGTMMRQELAETLGHARVKPYFFIRDYRPGSAFFIDDEPPRPVVRQPTMTMPMPMPEYVLEFCKRANVHLESARLDGSNWFYFTHLVGAPHGLVQKLVLENPLSVQVDQIVADLKPEKVECRIVFHPLFGASGSYVPLKTALQWSQRQQTKSSPDSMREIDLTLCGTGPLILPRPMLTRRLLRYVSRLHRIGTFELNDFPLWEFWEDSVRSYKVALSQTRIGTLRLNFFSEDITVNADRMRMLMECFGQVESLEIIVHGHWVIDTLKLEEWVRGVNGLEFIDLVFGERFGGCCSEMGCCVRMDEHVELMKSIGFEMTFYGDFEVNFMHCRV